MSRNAHPVAIFAFFARVLDRLVMRARLFGRDTFPLVILKLALRIEMSPARFAAELIAIAFMSGRHESPLPGQLQLGRICSHHRYGTPSACSPVK
jgi:hypothetical protein